MITGDTPAAAEVVTAFKGFDTDLQCRNFQFEVGQTYEHTGEVEACREGFHACEHPLNVFNYYPPATSRFALVSQWGKLSRHSDDTKVASAFLRVEAELDLAGLTQAAVKWVSDRAKWVEGPVAEGENEAATASGARGAATATGNQGAALASGTRGAATASGISGKVMGKEGSALFLVYRDIYTGDINHAWAGIAARGGIKPDTWYQLNADGQPEELAP